MSLLASFDVLQAGVLAAMWVGYLVVAYSLVVVLSGLYMRHLVLRRHPEDPEGWRQNATDIYGWFSWEIEWYSTTHRVAVTPVPVLPLTCRITTYELVEDGPLGRNEVEETRPLLPRHAFRQVTEKLRTHRSSMAS